MDNAKYSVYLRQIEGADLKKIIDTSFDLSECVVTNADVWHATYNQIRENIKIFDRSVVLDDDTEKAVIVLDVRKLKQEWDK